MALRLKIELGGSCGNYLRKKSVMSVKIKGIVKWWNDSKGYGFLAQENGEDIFVHYSAIQMEGKKTLQEGQQVEFSIEKGPKGFSAAEVVVIGPAPVAPKGEEKPSSTIDSSSLLKTLSTSLFSLVNVSNDLVIGIPESSRALRVFLCHSSHDKPVVRDLYRRLSVDQIDPWLDEEKLLPGQDWNQEIMKAVRASDVVIVCLSRGSINKAGYIQKEIKYALDIADEQPEGTIFLIPLKLEECEMPERLRRWQWVNYFDEAGYKRLMDALRIRAQNVGAKAPPELRLSQVLKKYEGQRIKAKGNDRKDQFFVFKGELHYIDLGAAEICENSGLPYIVLDTEEEFILSQAARGDDYNALQMKAALSEAFSPKTTRVKPAMSILFLAADPTDASRLRLGEEMREIQEKLQLAKLRDQFELNSRMSVRPADVSQALLDLSPQVVHFSGHGTRDALIFEDSQGNAQLVSSSALAALFKQFSNQVRCVILNACYSESQAQAIANHIEYVVGTNQAIGDKAAIAFSVGFYQALGAGRTFEDAYKLGCVQIRLQGIPEHLTPALKSFGLKILKVLSRSGSGPRTKRGLRDDTGLDITTVTDQLNILEKNGFVSIERTNGERWAITALGKKLLEDTNQVSGNLSQ
jgi:cold shock CspA family protein/predicted transcriptional regulator